MNHRWAHIVVAAVCVAALLGLVSCGKEEPVEPELSSSEQAAADARYQAILDERIAEQAANKDAEDKKIRDAEEAAMREVEKDEAAAKAAEEAQRAQAEADAQVAADAEAQAAAQTKAQQAANAAALRAALNIGEDYRDSFVHGPKPAECQKYIVLHDTEGGGDPWGVVNGWDNGAGVAAHFVVGKDGSIVQCVNIDTIAHHAGFGDAGHNASYGVEDESRDDKVGTVPIGDWAPDYGMNSYSVGIEMIHIGGEGDYPETQLQAVDNLIAYIDAYYGFQSTIIDHKAWRTGNSDTSPEFAGYLANYQDHRTHD